MICRLIAASISRDQMNVLGEASALTCERSEPGNGSASDRADGTKETIASRNVLCFGSKHSGAPRSTSPRTLSGAKAQYIAASVPPRECPIRNGFAPRPSADNCAIQLEIARAYSTRPLLPVPGVAGSHSNRYTCRCASRQYRIALVEGVRSQMYGRLIGAATMSADRDVASLP